MRVIDETRTTVEWKICSPLLLFSTQAPVRFTGKTVRFRWIQCKRIQVATDGTRPPSTMKSRYQPGGATVPAGGDRAWTWLASWPVIAQPTNRWDWFQPWVTAPGRISTTSAIDGALGVLIVKSAP